MTVRRGAFRYFFADQEGATAIEYGLIAGGIFLAIVPPIMLLAERMDATYIAILNYFAMI